MPKPLFNNTTSGEIEEQSLSLTLSDNAGAVILQTANAASTAQTGIEHLDNTGNQPTAKITNSYASTSAGAYGIYATIASHNGGNSGAAGYFESSWTGGMGPQAIQAEYKGTSGGRAIYAHATNGVGVHAVADNSSGVEGYGVTGVFGSGTAYGGYFVCTADGVGGTYGIYAENQDNQATSWIGNFHAANGAYGIHVDVGTGSVAGEFVGKVTGTIAENAPAALFTNTTVASSSQAHGIKATTSSTNTNSTGGWFESTGSGRGVVGISSGDAAGYFSTSGNTSSSVGVSAATSSTDAGATAGYFYNSGSGSAVYGETTANIPAGNFNNSGSGSNAAGDGVQATTASTSTSAAAIRAIGGAGYAVVGTSTGNRATGSFSNSGTSANNSGYGVDASTASTGTAAAVRGTNSGSGYGGQFITSGASGLHAVYAQITNASNGNNAVRGETNGTGAAGYFSNTNSGSNASGHGGFFTTTSINASAAGVSATNAGGGPAIYGTVATFQSAIYGKNTEVTSLSTASHGVKGETSSSNAASFGIYGLATAGGSGVYGTSSGSGYGGQFVVSASTGLHAVYAQATNASFANNAIRGENAGTLAAIYGKQSNTGSNASAYGVYGETSSSNGNAAGVYGLSTTGGTGVIGYVNTNVPAIFAWNNGSGANAAGDGVKAETDSTSTSSAAVRAIAGSGYAIIGTGSGNQAIASFANSASGSSASAHAVKATTSSTSASAAGGYLENTGGGYGAYATSSGIGLFAVTSSTTKEAVIGKSAIASTTAMSTTDVPVIEVQDSAGNKMAGIYHDGTISGHNSQNWVINGDMEICQRYGPGGSHALATAGAVEYVVDRWRMAIAGTGAVACTVSQQLVGFSSGILPYAPKYFMRWAQTAGTTTTTATIQTYIDDLWKFQNRVMTLSFWAKADSNRSLDCQFIQYFGTGGSSNVNTSAQTNNLTTTWQRFSYTVTVPSLSGKTVNDGNALFISMSPTTLNLTQTIDITNVQLEFGPIATAFKPRGFDQEYNDCLRFYQKSFPYTTVPATNTGSLVGSAFMTCVVAGAVNNQMYVHLPVTLRSIPGTTNITLYNPSAANAQVRNATRSNDSTGAALGTGITGDKGFLLNFTGVAASWVAGDQLNVHWAISVEL